MTEIKALTRGEIEKRLGIGRTKFVVDVQPFLEQIPSFTNTNLYTIESVERFEKNFVKQKPGRKPKKEKA